MTLEELFTELERLREQRQRLDLSSPESLATRAEGFVAEAALWASVATASDFCCPLTPAHLLLIAASVAAEDRAAERADMWRASARRVAERRERTSALELGSVGPGEVA